MQYLSSYFRAANVNSYAGTFLWSLYANVPEVSLMLSTGTEGPNSAIASEGIAGYNFMWGQVYAPPPSRTPKYHHSRPPLVTALLQRSALRPDVVSARQGRSFEFASALSKASGTGVNIS